MDKTPYDDEHFMGIKAFKNPKVELSCWAKILTGDRSPVLTQKLMCLDNFKRLLEFSSLHLDLRS